MGDVLALLQATGYFDGSHSEWNSPKFNLLPEGVCVSECVCVICLNFQPVPLEGTT